MEGQYPSGDAVLDHSRCILHIDLNCFYAQVEALANPSLQGRPLGVRQKGLLVTCNYEARARGVSKMHGIKEALAICPEMVIIDGSDLTPYRKASDDIFRMMKRYSSNVRKLGLDECFLDITALVRQRMESREADSVQEFVGHLYGYHDGFRADPSIDCDCGCIDRLRIASAAAQEIRQALATELGFQTCGGISVNKNLAKLVGDLHKPNQQTTLLPQDAHDMISPMRMREIPGCGYRLTHRLAEMSIHTAAELQRIPLALLAEQFGSRVGRTLFRLCRGLDEEDGVKPTEAAKTMSEEDSFRHCVTRTDAEARLRTLMAQLLERLDDRWDETGEAPQTLRFSLRQANEDYYSSRSSRQTFFPQISLGSRARNSADENARLSLLMLSLLELFDKLVGGESFEIVLFNVAAADFKHSSDNGSLQPISNYFAATESDSERRVRPRRHTAPPSTQAATESCTFSSLEPGELLVQCTECGSHVLERDAREHLRFHKILLPDANGAM